MHAQKLIREDFFEHVKRYLTDDILAKGLKCFTVLKVLATCQFLYYEFYDFFSSGNVMLQFKNLSQAFYGSVLNVDITLDCKLLQKWNQVIMNFWHVKKMDDIVEILKKPQVFPPHAFLITDILSENHNVFKQI